MLYIYIFYFTVYWRYQYVHIHLRLFETEPVCAHGEPLSGRTCGGMLPGNDCPSGYTCVGELVPVDGPGVCCPSKQGQSIRVLGN